MSVCAHRPESPGMFTPCALARPDGCRCGTEAATDHPDTEPDHDQEQPR